MTSIVEKILPILLSAGVSTVKAKGGCNTSGTITANSKGIASTLRVSTGRFRFTWIRPYNNNTYSVVAFIVDSGSTANMHSVRIFTQATTHIDLMSQFMNAVIVNVRNSSCRVISLND